MNRRFISTRRAGPRPRTALTQWASPPGLAQRMSKAGPAACRRGARCKHSALLNSYRRAPARTLQLPSLPLPLHPRLRETETIGRASRVFSS